MGITTHKVFEDDTVLHYRKGERSLFTGGFPPMKNPVAYLDALNFHKKLDSLGKKVPLHAPWNSASAKELDSITLQQWCDNILWTERARDTAKVFANINFTVEPREVSLLWALWYTKGAQGVLSINSTEGGAQERMLVGGAQQLAEGTVAPLRDKILLNNPVTSIKYSENDAEVSTIHGQKFLCDYVILALPPVVQQKIIFWPPLPANRNQLMQRVPMGSVIKTYMYYKEAYWRQRGFCGTSWIEESSIEIPVGGTCDTTNQTGTHPVLMGFILGDKAKECSMYTKETRKKVIAQCYSKVFNIKELLEPIHYEEKDWCTDQWTGGGYTGWMPPGVLTTYGKDLRRPVGCMYFAGTETATVWSGYMEGAIQAGERAAKEVLHNMGKISEEEVWAPEPPCPECPVSSLRFSRLERLLPSVTDSVRLVVALFTAAGIGVGLIVTKKA